MNHQSFSTRQTLKRLPDYPDVLTVEQVSELLGVCTNDPAWRAEETERRPVVSHPQKLCDGISGH